jgi:hypothetical protein
MLVLDVLYIQPKVVFDTSTPPTIQLSYHTFNLLARPSIRPSPSESNLLCNHQTQISEISVENSGIPVAWIG